MRKRRKEERKYRYIVVQTLLELIRKKKAKRLGEEIERASGVQGST